MKLHFQYCYKCEKETLFVEKLVNPQSPTCFEEEDVCQECGAKYYQLEKKIKPKLRI